MTRHYCSYLVQPARRDHGGAGAVHAEQHALDQRHADERRRDAGVECGDAALLDEPARRRDGARARGGWVALHERLDRVDGVARDHAHRAADRPGNEVRPPAPLRRRGRRSGGCPLRHAVERTAVEKSRSTE